MSSRRRVPGTIRLLGLVVTAVLLLAGAGWAVHAGSGESSDSDVAVSGGVMRLEGLTDRTVGHAMGGMSMADMGAEDVPVGLRRFSVDVTLVADEGEELRYDVAQFLVSGPGVEPVRPVRALIGPGTVPAGRALTGTLTFDVPEQVHDGLQLRLAGSPPLPLPALPRGDGAEHQSPHGGGAGHANSSEGGHGDHGDHPH